MNTLPYEINKLIFNQLDKKNLQNCLYVNKAFAKFIYKILWRTISLKNVKVLANIWFENEEKNKNSFGFSNVVNPNLMFPYNEAVTVIECTYLNTITYDMERIINACKNVKCIIYQCSVIEKPILKFQRPLYQWELGNIPKYKYLKNQILLKKVDKTNKLFNSNYEWDDKTMTVDNISSSSVNVEVSSYGQFTEIEDEMSIMLNSIEQEFEISNEVIQLNKKTETYKIKPNNEFIKEEENIKDTDSEIAETDSSQTDYYISSSSSSLTSPYDNSISFNSLKTIPYPILSDLKILDFSNSCISPEVLESFIGNCSSLEEIIFLKNDISDKSLRQFMNCKTLKYLHINFEISAWDDEFTYEGFTSFVDFCSKKLQKLYIHSIKLLDKDMIIYLITHCPKNIYSIVFDSPLLTSQELSKFIKHSTKLEELVIGCRFTKCNIKKLPFDLNILYPDNESLYASSNTEITNTYNKINNNDNEISFSFDSLNNLFKYPNNTHWLRKLTKFEYHFEKMENGFFGSFISLVKEMKNLKYLRFSGEVNFTNKNIFDILFNLRQLRSLNLWIYNSQYNFNNFVNDNTNKETNINNILLSNLKSQLLSMHITNCINNPSNHVVSSPHHLFNDNSTMASLISNIYNHYHLIETSTPFAFTSDCLELISSGVCPKLHELTGYFSTDVLPEHLQKVILNLSYLNTIFISNFQLEQNNNMNLITKDYQLQWKTFAKKYKTSKTSQSSISQLNELNEILISSHRIVLSFNEGFIKKFKQFIEI